MKRIAAVILFLYLFCINTLCTNAQNDTKLVRVAISDTNFISYLYDNIEFNNAADLEVIDSQSGQMYSGQTGDGVLRFKMKNNQIELTTGNSGIVFPLSNRLTIRSKSGRFVQINGLKRNGKQAEYRGIFELVKNKEGNKFYCINILGIENYLRGVVPNEMPVRFGLEALKAQSVAARNYTIASKSKSKEEYDVSDSVASQVYFGAGTEKSLSDRAISETMGIIALSNEDEPILALYSSTSGGHSENYENAFSDIQTKEFPAQPKHYLKGKPDIEEYGELDSEEAVKEFYSTFPDTYDIDSPYYRWTREWTNDELESVLKKSVKDLSSTGFVSPKLSSGEDFGKLKDVKVIQRGVSGKAMFVQIITDKNIFVISKELMIRRCFKHNEKALPSANFYIEKINSGNETIYKFSGGGYGHGVGMSQWGAGRMASLGYTYDEILHHYYSNIRLTTVPEIMRANGEIKKQMFYSDLPKAWVYILHDSSFDTMYINVNGEILETDLRNKPTKIKIDISPYIKSGINEISYFTNDDNSRFNNYIDVYTEIKAEDNG